MTATTSRRGTAATIHERLPGVWTVQIELDPDPTTGRRRRPATTAHGTRHDAEVALGRFAIEMNRAPSRAQLDQVLRLARRDGPPWSTWHHVAFATGAQLDELDALRWADITPAHLLRLGDPPRNVRVPRTTITELERWHRSIHRPQHHVFPAGTATGRWATYARHAGIPQAVTVHDAVAHAHIALCAHTGLAGDQLVELITRRTGQPADTVAALTRAHRRVEAITTRHATQEPQPCPARPPNWPA